MKASIIQPSHSSFVSPALLVKKKDDFWRFCMEYMGLTEITVKIKFPIPIMEDLVEKLHSASCFQRLT